MSYFINDEYQLYIGGASKQDKPMYIYLSSRITNKKINIRYENVGNFLNEHKSY